MHSLYFSYRVQRARTIVISLLAVAVIALGLSFTFSHDAFATSSVCTWTGNGVNGNWSATANWDGCNGGAPSNGDSVVFPGTSFSNIPINDIADLTISKMTMGVNAIIDDGVPFTIAATDGIPLVIPVADGHVEIRNDFTIQGSTDQTVEIGNWTEISATINFNLTGTANFTLASGSDVRFYAPLTGSIGGDFVVGNDATGIFLSPDGSANTFTTGGFHINGNGFVKCGVDVSCFGDTNNTVYLDGGTIYLVDLNIDDFPYDVTWVSGGAGGTFEVYNGVPITGNFTIAADANIVTHDNSGVGLLGVTTLVGGHTLTFSGNSSSTITGKVTGNGNLTFLGSGNAPVYQFTGSVSNDYTGTTTFSGAGVSLVKDDNKVSIPGNIVIDALNNTDAPATLYDTTDEQIGDGATVSVVNGGIFFAYSGVSETLGTFTGDGTVAVNEGVLYVGGGNVSGTFAGNFDCGGSTIHKIGTGTWNLTGTNGAGVDASPVNFVVDEGKLITNFTDGSAASTPLVIHGGILGGTGIIGPTTVVGAIVAPGNSPGCLNPTSFTIDATSTFQMELNGTTPCSGYDVLDSPGVVAMSDPSLDISLGYAAHVGDTFVIIRGSSVTGTIAHLTDGTVFVSHNEKYKINYSSTAVTLTYEGRVPQTLPATGDNSRSTAVFSLMLILCGFVLALRRKAPKFVVQSTM